MTKLNKIKQLTDETIKNQIWDYYWEKYQHECNMSDEIYNLIFNILTRGKLGQNPLQDDAIYNAESDENIYTSDHGAILKEYAEGPENADWDACYNEFLTDLLNIQNNILNSL